MKDLSVIYRGVGTKEWEMGVHPEFLLANVR